LRRRVSSWGAVAHAPVHTLKKRVAPGVSGAEGPAARRRLTVLVVGEPALASSAVLGPGSPVAFAQLQDVGAELIDTLRPDIILTPLLSASFDCIDLAIILSALNYRGSFRVLCPLIPSPELIRREIRALCPELEFELIFVPAPEGATA
jgi:hypothetical protein